MAKLVLSMDGLVLKEIPLVKERLSIGRKAHNDIQIDNMAISGEHAVVVTILNDSFLEDLNSTNGTLVNGQPIRKHFLKDGDVIELGKYRMKYITGSSESTDDLWQTTSIGFSAGVTGRPAPAQGGQAGGTTLPAATIRLLSGANAGHQLKLTKTLTTLGKPGQVAVIARKPQGYFLTHVEGGEFPLLNGQAVDVRPRRLENHDLIEIAGVKMEFFFNN
ncbi:FHA domain-containing protein [Accumulibacter sp.]|uniref:FHA domain-containing protein n=1 Tax=Accumulibacter sp. TaxID=2053492 RepID=UPI0025FEC053|nr:FHA domain-containing protein [Accumulibacter sp.]MCM8596078.1 FHA domain-containing protein [Accumulibacter sp.]MCM8627021.1 FHA domain-containing protein [Accumulibacter sp.]MDS4050227.1 FHA domain-containing protein [Accumulibacter sp.]